MRCVPMTVTVQTMRSAAASRCGRQCMALSTGMLYKCTGHIFLHYSDSFSDLVSLCLYNRKAWSVSEGIRWSKIV